MTFIRPMSWFKKKSKSIDDPSNDPARRIDSAFAASCIKTDSAWEDELERTQQQEKSLAFAWYQSLDELTKLVDKVTSPFHNTNRTSLHQTQQFIEAYLDDWKAQRYEKEQAHVEKIQLAHARFSGTAELESCVVTIYGMEKALYLYRSTMDAQLTLLWNTRPNDQDMTEWKAALQQYHHASSQMEAKLKDLLETATPNPDDYTCAVCLSLFTDPVTLHPCLHTFCKSCVQHIYCTCQLTQCESACHQYDNAAPIARYCTPQQQRLKKTSSVVDLQCGCPLSWSVPPAAQCPLCRHAFAPEDCTVAVGLDNLIRFYFPRHDGIQHQYHARQKRLKRRSAIAQWSQKWLHPGLPTVPLPPRRQSPSFAITQHLASLASQSFVL